MSKLTKLTKAVPANKAVNSRYFTTPTRGDWAKKEGFEGIDELLAEFYIQSRDCSGSSVDPVDIAKLLNMVGLKAVATSGVNNEDYLVRTYFTGEDICGNILLSAITPKFIDRNPNVINQLLDITVKYNGNEEDSVKNTRPVYLFPNVVDIARHSATRGALGHISTWVEAGIRVDSTDFSIAEDSAIQTYMEEEGLTLDDYRNLVTLNGAFTGSIDGEVFGPFSQITTGLPLGQVVGIGGDECDGGLTLIDVMNEVSLENYFEEEGATPEGSSDYWARLYVACFFFKTKYSDILAWIVAPARNFSEAVLLSVLEDFNTLSDGYLYSELTLDERVKVLNAKSIAVLVHVLNDDESVEDLVNSIIAHKTSGLTSLASATNLPQTPTRVSPASEGYRKFFGVLSQVVENSTHTDRTLSYDDLDGSEYAVLFYYTRAASSAGGAITISSKVQTVYTPELFTQSGNNLSDANVSLLLDALGLTQADELNIRVGALRNSVDDVVARGKVVTLFNAFGAANVLKLVVVTTSITNWNHGKTVLELYLQIVGSDTNEADTMLRHIYDVMTTIRTVRSMKTSIQASCHTAAAADTALELTAARSFLKGLLRLLDHGASPSDIYELLGTSDTDKRTNVRLMASTVSAVASAAVDWRKVNELIQLAGIQTFSAENNGVMNVTSAATMLDNWALAFADTDADTYAQLREAGFAAWELLTYTRTTNVYKVVNGRAVKGANEVSMAFNIEWVCEAYDKTFAELQKEAYENYGITLADGEDN